jgi:hypothetical protein
MIGPSNRVAATHSPRVETALAFTAPGQATWADSSNPHTCADCAHFAKIIGRGKGVGRCREYWARMQGLHGPPIDRRQQACGAFDLAAKP